MLHTHVKTVARRRPDARTLMWLPAALLVAWGLLSAAGVPLTPRSDAASSGGSIIEATVPLDIHIAGTCTTGTTYDLGSLAIGANTQACTVTFGTNNGLTGSTLKVHSARTTPGDPFFCQTADSDDACDPALAFSAPSANAASLTGGQFGVRSATIGSCTTATWTAGNYNPVPDSGSPATICAMSGAGKNTDGSYDLEFVANRAAATPAGDYVGEAVFTVEAS